MKNLSPNLLWGFIILFSDSSALDFTVHHGGGRTNKTCGYPHKVRGSTAISQSQISRLAEIIRAETRNVESYFHENGLVLPCFEVDSSIDFHNLPTHISRSRQEVIQATQELKSLMLGPKESVRWMAWDVCAIDVDPECRFSRLKNPLHSTCELHPMLTYMVVLYEYAKFAIDQLFPSR